MWMSFFTSELPMMVEFVVSPLRGWARVAPPLVIGPPLTSSNLRFQDFASTLKHKSKKTL